MDFVLEKPFRGLILSYFENPELKGEPVKFAKSSSINMEASHYEPVYNFGKINNFGLRWTGQLKAPVSGQYTFSIQVADGVKFWLNNKLLINSWKEQDSITYSAQVKLDSAQVYPFRLDYYNGRGESLVKLFWEYPGKKKQLIPASAFVPEESGFLPKQEYVPYDFSVISDGKGAIVDWRDPELRHPGNGNSLKASHKPGDFSPEGLTKVTYSASTASKLELEKSFDVLVYQASKLKATYFDTIPGGKEILSRYEPFIDYEWKREIPGTDPLVRDSFATQWEGEVFAPASGEYIFSIRGDNKARLYLNDSLLIDAWEKKSGLWESSKIDFEKGESIRIRMDYYHNNDFIVAKLYWKVPGTRYQLIRFREK